MDIGSRAQITGLFTFTLIDPDGNITLERSHGNTLTYDGLSLMAMGLAYSGVADIGSTIGIPNPFYISPIFGAIGSGTLPVTTTASDISLVDETARTTCSVAANLPAAGINPAQCIWQFFFGNNAYTSHYNPQTQTVEVVTTTGITEAGVFLQASTQYGTLLNHVEVSPAVYIPTGYLLQLQVAIGLGLS